MRACLRIGAVLATLVAGSATALADTTVRWFISENSPEQTVWQREIAKRYEESHPGTKIDIQVMSGEPYKSKLTTMLQSNERPHLIYTWGGGVLFAQADAGLLQDISDKMKGAWAESLNPAALDAMTYKGKVYGAPTHQTMVALWYNKRLLSQAGVDPASMSTWDGLLAATRRLKEANIQPFSAGGSDKWPLNMFWSGLAVRIGGKQGFEDALNRKPGAGFDGPVFTRASEMFKQLIDLAPFQRGFLGDTAPQAAGQFGDGKVALQVMGNWFYNTQRSQSSQGGVSDADLGWMPFPQVSEGKGDPSDVVGGINGFLVTRGAPPEAADFLRYYTSPDVQREGARRGFFIPAARGAGEELQNPIFRGISGALQKAHYVQNFYDQMMGPSVGRVINDTSADLAAGRMTPKQVGRQIQDAWDLEQ